MFFPLRFCVDRTPAKVAITLAFLGLVSAMVLPTSLPTAWAQVPDYAYYYNLGNQLYERGDLTKAIDAYKSALPLAKGQSVLVVYNNLSAILMRRGNAYINQRKLEESLADFRQAVYYLEWGWPEGEALNDKQQTNRDIARENLMVGYQNLGINPKDKSGHLKTAKALRQQGRFQESVVEYGQVVLVDKNNTEALKALGDLFNVLNAADKSKKYYQQAIAVLGPQQADSQLYTRLGTVQNKAGDIDGAVASLNMALEKNPDNTTALQQLEDIWLRELRFNNKSVLGHANYASILQKKKNFTAAQKEYELAEYHASLDPKTPLDVKKRIRINMGTFFQETRNFPMALKAYDSVLQLDANQPEVRVLRATVLKDMGQTDKAMAEVLALATGPNPPSNAVQTLMDWTQAIPNPQQQTQQWVDLANRLPGNAVFQTKAAESLHQQKQLEQALGYYQRASQLQPTEASHVGNMGAILQSLNRFDEAQAYLKKAATLDPKNPTYQQYLASAKQAADQERFAKAVQLQQAGKYPEAAKAYQLALQTAPGTPDILLNYGVCLQQAGRLPEAIAQYQAVLKQQPQSGQAAYLLGTVYHQQEQYTQASTYYAKALQDPSLEPDAKSACETALAAFRENSVNQKLADGMAAYEAKNYTAALTALNAALKEAPNNSTAHYYKALVLNDQNRTAEALASYERAVQADKGFKDAYFGLAVAYEKAKNPLKAKQTYQQYIQLAKQANSAADADYIQYAQERLKAL